MAFSEAFLDEIRARVPIAQVVGKKVKLTKRGREYTGLCPFHHEKSPSFTVNEDKGFYHCFGCQAHGSLFDFVMKTEGLEFPEAVERLAADAGVAMPARTPRDAEDRDERADLYKALQAAADWFADQLRQRGGAEARTYLESRKLGAAVVTQFKIGYAPEARTSLKDTFVGRGMSEKLLLDAGLIIKPEDGRDTYDRFRDRVMFPITDSRGRTVAFGGRTLGDAKPKYLNSPETTLFHKGTLLYNLAAARAAARDAGTVVLCEGYTDVIALTLAGYPAAVAPLGTAVSDRQLEELWRMAPEPIVCLDGDSAGWQAAVRAARHALPLLKPGHSLRFAALPAGEDPDSLVRAGRGAEVKAALEAAIPLSDVLWRTAATGDFSTPERRAGLQSDLKELVREIAHPVVREYYKRHFSMQLQAAFPPATRAAEARREFRGDFRGEGRGEGRRGFRAVALRPKLSSGKALGAGSGGSPRQRERVLMAALVNHPGLLKTIEDELGHIGLADSELDTLRQGLLDIAPLGESLDSAGLRAQLTGTARTVADRLAQESLSMVEKFVRPEALLADVEEQWRDVLAQHQRAAGEIEHHWF